ncbi:class I SAM-dependent methyltransferase [Brevibacterium sp. p3-SID960]|uniref:class I SAM-dependent methyltransferase n=1 Tax=Brevibacterium sp. p3-SID960 TaxID=2916063 RepID=UPI0021A5096B|nr:class I SAM-dependent methyltransferase [Brevibacterium sp. p3-SID960]MCT1689418.1 class I SAM-dependent methyltransferase [Brevibacterium sp. p3-SID960]
MNTTPTSASVPVPASHETTLRRLAELLRESFPFSPEAAPLWDTHAQAAIERSNAAPAIVQTQARVAAGEIPAPEAVLALLFTLDQAVDAGDVAEACGPELYGALRADGWLIDAGETGSNASGKTSGEATSTGTGGTTGGANGSGTTGTGGTGDGHVRAALTITTFDGLLIAADWGTLTRGEPLAGDHVLGLGGAGRTLAAITPRMPVELSCDIGTGCGIQALLLAAHSQRVIATDISGRALAIAELNAGLNGIESIEFRAGDMLTPIDEPVDLLVANPPFVITPQGQTQAFEYRDGGQPGDTIMAGLIAGIPERLRPDGNAVLLGNWEYHAAGKHSAPGDPSGGLTVPEAVVTEVPAPIRWCEELSTPGSPAAETSMLLIEREHLDPVAYAETWIRDGGVARMSDRWQVDTAAWLHDFGTRGVARIGFGWIRMHRAPTPSHRAPTPSHRAPTPSQRALHHLRETGPLAGDTATLAAVLDTRLAVLEWLAGTDDAGLERTAFIRGQDLVEHRHHTPGEDEPHTITYEQGTGFGRTITADTALAGLLGVSDGSLTLGAISDALAQLLDADPAALRAQLTGQVRRLLADGFLFPVLEPGDRELSTR